MLATAVHAAPALPNVPNGTFSITDYGARGDGLTTNTVAIQTAIDAASAAGGGTVEIPAAEDAYLCGPFTLANNINLQIDAGAILRMLPFGSYPAIYSTNVAGAATNLTWRAANFISGANLHDIEISGSGAIDGQGLPWWPYAKTAGDVRPIMIRLTGCNRELIQNVTLSNSPMFHIAISGKNGNTTVQGVTIVAPASTANPPSHNTDACDVSGTNILIQNCNISVGDDNFTCGGGTSDVLLTNNTYGNGHGVSIGSFTSPSVSNITVINCTFNGTDNGIRIKSDTGRGGLVQNISYYNIGMTNVRFPIQVYGYYNEVGTPGRVSPYYASTQTVAAVTGTTPIFRNIIFSNINATSIEGYPVGIIWARTEMPATNIVFDRVNVTGDRNFCLYNASGVRFIDSKITVSASNTFALFNTQVIVTNSTLADPVFTFDGLATNGYDNGLAFYNADEVLKNAGALGAGSRITLGASKLTIGDNLKLEPSSVINFVLGSNAAEVIVTSNLFLDGTINLSSGNGFTTTNYLLFEYDGQLGGAATLGMAPAGYQCALNTNTAGQVKLITVQPPGHLRIIP